MSSDPQSIEHISSMQDYDPLISTPYFRIGGDDYTPDISKFLLRCRLIDICIDKLKKEGVLPLSLGGKTTPDRLKVKKYLDDTFYPMTQKLEADNYEYGMDTRNGIHVQDMVWLSLHLYLQESQMTRENVEKYVLQCEKGRRPWQSEQAMDHQFEYYGKRSRFEYSPSYLFLPPNA
jgi:hypothetical protein